MTYYDWRKIVKVFRLEQSFEDTSNHESFVNLELKLVDKRK